MVCSAGGKREQGRKQHTFGGAERDGGEGEIDEDKHSNCCRTKHAGQHAQIRVLCVSVTAKEGRAELRKCCAMQHEAVTTIIERMNG